MRYCKECFERTKKEGWYIGHLDEVVEKENCEQCPSLDSWRLRRTLRTIKSFGLEPEGYVHPNCKIRPVSYGDGWVHKRVLTSIIFDYEQPFIEELTIIGALELQGDCPVLIRVTPQGDKLICKWDNEKEATKDADEAILKLKAMK